MADGGLVTALRQLGDLALDLRSLRQFRPAAPVISGRCRLHFIGIPGTATGTCRRKQSNVMPLPSMFLELECSATYRLCTCKVAPRRYRSQCP